MLTRLFSFLKCESILWPPLRAHPAPLNVPAPGVLLSAYNKQEGILTVEAAEGDAFRTSPGGVSRPGCFLNIYWPPATFLQGQKGRAWDPSPCPTVYLMLGPEQRLSEPKSPFPR